jgi:hypothetical protein
MFPLRDAELIWLPSGSFQIADNAENESKLKFPLLETSGTFAFYRIAPSFLQLILLPEPRPMNPQILQNRNAVIYGGGGSLLPFAWEIILSKN